jgi:FixJ family two-component response regulator
LQSLNPNLKLLFISGYPDDVTVQRGGMKGVVHFLQKPFSTSDLVSKVWAVLDERRQGVRYET